MRGILALIFIVGITREGFRFEKRTDQLNKMDAILFIAAIISLILLRTL